MHTYIRQTTKHYEFLDSDLRQFHGFAPHLPINVCLYGRNNSTQGVGYLSCTVDIGIAYFRILHCLKFCLKIMKNHAWTRKLASKPPEST
jgi:hypothetical protein